MSLCVKVLIDGMNISLIKESLFIIFYGCIRNEFFAYSLWFLSCFGLPIGASNPLKVILYVIILFAIECIILIPFELKIKENLNSFF